MIVVFMAGIVSVKRRPAQARPAGAATNSRPFAFHWKRNRGDGPIDARPPIAMLAALLVLSGAAALPEQGPLPLPRPEEKPAQEPAEKKPDKTPDRTQAKDQRPTESKAEFEACRAALSAIGARFDTAPAIDDGAACGIERPVLLKGLAGEVKVEPPATIRCETALQLARWFDGAVKTSLSAAMPDESIAALQQASGYVCRNRNNAAQGRISEHAFGNAVDIAGFSLASGKVLEIRPADRDSTLEGAFQRAITEAACLYFTTVLDPGSDAAHENHLHLDVKERRGGYRYCW